jgi:hypothetical protein
MSKKEKKKKLARSYLLVLFLLFYASAGRLYGRRSHRPYEINKLFTDRIDNNIVNLVHQQDKAFTLILTTG